MMGAEVTQSHVTKATSTVVSASEPINDMDKRRVFRHRAVVRVTHWINVVCLAVLLMSGLQIFNAHPALYWGDASDFQHPFLEIEDGFPGWITLPAYQDLATGRRWHFFFAWLFVVNGLVYLVSGFINRHFQRDLAPSGSQLRHVGRSIVDHLRLRFPTGEA